MSQERELRSFLQEVCTEVRERALGNGAGSIADFKENVFTEYVLDNLAEAGVIENYEVCYFESKVGRGTAKVNGYGINDDGDRLDLVVSIYTDSMEPVRILGEEIAKATGNATRFYEAAARGLHKEMEKSSEPFGMASRIHDADDDIQKIRVLVISDGLLQTKKLREIQIEGKPVFFELWDIERLCKVIYSGQSREETIVNFEEIAGKLIPCLPMPSPANDYDVYMAILPGEILYRVYEEYGARLLELNVRSFLQAKGKVNKGIRNTLKNEPDRFMAYNNGIFVTAESMELEYLPDGVIAIKSITGMQIVNGGQTTASIHRAKKHDKISLDNVYVSMKITIIEDPQVLEDLVPKISQYANTQNVIQLADFSANEPFHIDIERLSRSTWCPGERDRWFYERARGQYQVEKSRFSTSAQLRKFAEQSPVSKKFTKTDLAKYIQSWEQLPHIVSKGGQKNFIHLMEHLREKNGQNWRPDEVYYKQLIAKAILFKTVQRIVRDEKIPAYRNNVTAYLVAYFSLKLDDKIDLNEIWSRQGISQALSNMLAEWSHEINNAILGSASGRNVSEWCKKDECWKVISKLALSLPDNLPPELASRDYRKTMALEAAQTSHYQCESRHNEKEVGVGKGYKSSTAPIVLKKSILDYSISEIEQAIIESLKTSPNNTCMKKAIVKLVCQYFGVITRSGPREIFESRADRALSNLVKKGYIQEYKAKNERLKLIDPL